MPDEKKPVKPQKLANKIKFDPTGIPNDLKCLDQWVCWRYVEDKKVKGKWIKLPINPTNGQPGDATSVESSGHSYEVAMDAMANPEFRISGLGIILGNGLAGIDLDGVIDEKGKLNERGERLSHEYRATYAEVSPSGQGFKVFLNIGDDPKLALIGKNTPDIEMYGSKRFFTVTGHRLPSHAWAVTDLQVEFAETARQINALKTYAPGYVRDIVGLEAADVEEMLTYLPDYQAEDYQPWIDTGMALHHEFDGSEEGLELWEAFSQRSDKYVEGVCEQRWQTFGISGKDLQTLRSLMAIARKNGWDDPTRQSSIEAFAAQLNAVAEVADIEDPQQTELNDSAFSYFQQEPEPVKWLWEGVLRQGKLLVLAGAGGSSKSYVALSACIKLTLGQSWGPFVIPDSAAQKRALIIYAEEDREDVHYRLNALKKSFMLTEKEQRRVGTHLFIRPGRNTVIQFATQDQYRETRITDQMKALENRIVKTKIDLLVLDPLAMIHGLEENDNRAMAELVRSFDGICVRTGCSIILVHHFAKGKEKAIDVNEANVRGASSVVAHARSVAVMARMREDEAKDWAVPSEDAHQYTMFAVVKNNYGRNDLRYWFKVSETTGALDELSHQLSHDAAVRSNKADKQIKEIEEVRKEKGVDERGDYTNLTQRRMQIILQASRKKGKLISAREAASALLGTPYECGKSVAMAPLQAVKDMGYCAPDGSITAKGIEFADTFDLYASD